MSYEIFKPPKHRTIPSVRENECRTMFSELLQNPTKAATIDASPESVRYWAKKLGHQGKFWVRDNYDGSSIVKAKLDT